MSAEPARSKRTLTPEEWQEIRDLLANTIQLPTNERAAYLDNVCHGDEALRAELQSLLAAHEIAEGGIFERPIAPTNLGEDLNSTAGRISQVAGERVGAYRIEAEIGRGGMGKVYRARRADDRFSKEVAIKFLDHGALSERSLGLFRHEREILANLEHPYIARLIDAGESEDGVPYFVMEYVDGESIDRYCDAHRLTIEQRLSIFLKVCSAVHYAHQNLVIHRDIKPDNILVTQNGDPKLLDFGIAKINDANANTKTLTAWRALTPAYASPEQLLGRPLNVATDIYSLGLVLYELLTGRYAYGGHPSALELQRAILEQDPQRPSAAIVCALQTSSDQTQTADQIGEARQLTSQKLCATLRGDLESIALKALRKDPSERYASTERLAEDIDRYLHRLPVRARQRSLAYSLRKFVLRNKGAAFAGSLAFLFLVLGVVFVLREAHIAQVERAHAERRFNDVRKLANSLLFDLHDAIQDLPGSTPARKLIVEKSLQYLDSLSSEGVSDTGLLRELATAYERVGELQGHYLADNLGETSNSMASYRKALGIRQQLGERRNAEWQDRLSLAESYRRMASQLSAMNDTREALADIEKATAIAESVAKSYPTNSKVLYELGFDFEILGNVQDQSFFEGWGNLNAALETYNKAAAVDQKMLSLDPRSLPAQRGLAQDLMQIGNAQSDLDHFTDAAETFNQSLKIFLAITERSAAVRDRRRVAVIYNQLGMLYDRAGSWKVSLENHKKGLRIYKELVAEDPKNALLRQGLAIAYVNTGDGESKLGYLAEGRADISQGIAIMKTLMSDPNAQQRDVLGQMHMSLADALARSHQPFQSMREYLDALEMYESLHSSPTDTGTQLSLATCKVGIAKAERLTGQPGAATADFQQALNLTAASVQKKNRDALRAAAQAYEGLGDIEAAKATRSHLPEREIYWKNAIEKYRQSLDVGEQIPAFAQIDPMGFRAADVNRRLQRAESQVSNNARSSY